MIDSIIIAIFVDFDYNMLVDTGIPFNATNDGKRVAELSVISPERFSDLRKLFGISDFQFFRSIWSNPFVSFQSNSKGAARANGVFFYTRDGAYMVKTIKVCVCVCVCVCVISQP